MRSCLRIVNSGVNKSEIEAFDLACDNWLEAFLIKTGGALKASQFFSAEAIGKGWAVALLLVVLGVWARAIPHPPNFSPLAAIALFSGAQLGRRWLAIATPLLVLFISDWAMGFYPGWPYVYGAFAATAFLGFGLAGRGWLSTQGAASALLLRSALAALGFFVITNLGVWLAGDLYPLSRQGLAQCFVAALPFFRNTLSSTVLFAFLLFGLKWAADRALQALRSAEKAL